MKRAVSVTELIHANHKALEFDGAWLNAIGKPERRGSWLIWGNSANGKTRFALQLAKYLANFGKVAYNAMEEGASLSMKNAFIQTNMKEVKRRVLLLDQEPLNELIERLNKHKSPHFVIIDSVQYTGMSYYQYKQLRDGYPNKLFVLISHADGKEPAGRVAKQIRYDAFVKIWVEGYKAFIQSRYGGGAEYIIWPEGADVYWNE
ncbi:MAG: hypothetical protein K9I68_05445 [Bacteroidales bacterium]|nr:hypothetical protein [Bacteroidales bacterium]MCF8337892.1 hypothetical protein [Bacteroidales bacterium]